MILGELISHSQSAPVSGEEVWRPISGPGSLVDFHPFCQSKLVEIWPGVGFRDKIYYYSGLVIGREFTNWFEGQGYDLFAEGSGMQFKVTWCITPSDQDRCSLTITIKQVVRHQSEKRVRQNARLLGKYLKQGGKASNIICAPENVLSAINFAPID
jgi:hypothetical protein